MPTLKIKIRASNDVKYIPLGSHLMLIHPIYEYTHECNHLKFNYGPLFS